MYTQVSCSVVSLKGKNSLVYIGVGERRGATQEGKDSLLGALV